MIENIIDIEKKRFSVIIQIIKSLFLSYITYS